MDPALAAAFHATWPAESVREVGGFHVAHGHGGGDRVNSAYVVGGWCDADIAGVIGLQRDWQQPSRFLVLDEDEPLAATLTALGFQPARATAILQIETARLTGLEIPPVTAFDLWPALAIQKDIWQAGGIGADRLAVMERAARPRTSILGRVDDRAAGAAFVAIHGGVAMVHAVEVQAELRRKGLAGWMMRRAALWAAENGASRLALAVLRSNEPALSLYRAMGFAEASGYRYFTLPSA